VTALPVEGQGRERDIVPDFTQQTANDVSVKIALAGASIRTDGRPTFAALPAVGFVHDRVPTNHLPEGVPPLPYLHRQISKATAWIAGTFHGLGPLQVPAHLHEFCFRFNRRRLRGGVLERLIVALGRSTPRPYRCSSGDPLPRSRPARVGSHPRRPRPDPSAVRLGGGVHRVTASP